MDNEKALRKKQRATLNSLREACVYSTPLLISHGSNSYFVAPTSLKEIQSRDLNEVRILEFKKSQLPALTDTSISTHIRFNESDETISIPLTNSESTSDDLICFEFEISKTYFSNRRNSSRESLRESFYIPFLLYLNKQNTLPISGFVRVVDFDNKAIRFEIKVPCFLTRFELVGASIVLQENTFNFPITSFSIDIVRESVVESSLGRQQLIATVVSLVSSTKKLLLESERSVIQPKLQASTSFKFLLRESLKFDVKIDSLTLNGFNGSVEPRELFLLPRLFIAEHSETKVRFSVSKQGGELKFQFSSTSLGGRTQWFNYISHFILRYEYRFQPRDTKEITRLMLESGNYTAGAISDLVLQHGYLQHKWPLEETLPRTKYRWLVRDREDSIIGHTAGLRVSEKLWGAIDNIGSQSYDGSWNREFVSRWLRSFVELLKGHSSRPIVQWTFNPTAGVWTNFNRAMLDRPDLVYSRDTFWSVFLVNVPEVDVVERKLFSVEKLDVGNGRLDEWSQHIGAKPHPIISLLYNGIGTSSSFHTDFEHDYSISFKRHTYIIKKGNKPYFLLSFSNYPAWASFNKTHDWHYLFPINESVEISKSEELELFALIKETVFRDGCTPFRMCIVSEKIKLSVGNEWTNLMLEPEALEFAALTLEQL